MDPIKPEEQQDDTKPEIVVEKAPAPGEEDEQDYVEQALQARGLRPKVQDVVEDVSEAVVTSQFASPEQTAGGIEGLKARAATEESVKKTIPYYIGDQTKNFHFKLADATKNYASTGTPFKSLTVGNEQFNTKTRDLTDVDMYLAGAYYMNNIASEEERTINGEPVNFSLGDFSEADAKFAYNKAREYYDAATKDFSNKYRDTQLPFSNPETGEFSEEYADKDILGIDTDAKTAYDRQKKLFEFTRDVINKGKRDEVSDVLASSIARNFAVGNPRTEFARGIGETVRGFGILGATTIGGAALSAADTVEETLGALGVIAKKNDPELSSMMDQTLSGLAYNVISAQFDEEGSSLDALRKYFDPYIRAGAAAIEVVEDTPIIGMTRDFNTLIEKDIRDMYGDEYFEENKDKFTLASSDVAEIYRHSFGASGMGAAANLFGQFGPVGGAINTIAKSTQRGIRELGEAQIRSAKGTSDVAEEATDAVSIAKQMAQETIAKVPTKVLRGAYRATMPVSRIGNRVRAGMEVAARTDIPPSLQKELTRVSQSYRTARASGNTSAIDEAADMLQDIQNKVTLHLIKNKNVVPENLRKLGLARMPDPIVGRMGAEEAVAALAGGAFIANVMMKEDGTLSPYAELVAMGPMIMAGVAGNVTAEIAMNRPTIREFYQQNLASIFSGSNNLSDETKDAIIAGGFDPTTATDVDGLKVAPQVQQSLKKLKRILKKFSPEQRRVVMANIDRQRARNKEIFADADREIENLNARIEELETADPKLLGAGQGDLQYFTQLRDSALQYRADLDSASTRAVGYLMGMAEYASYTNRALDGNVVDFRSLKNMPKSLQNAFTSQIKLKRNKIQTDAALEGLMMRIARNPMAKDLPGLQKNATRFVEELKQDIAAMESEISTFSSRTEDLVSRMINAASSMRNEATVTQDQYNAFIGDIFEQYKRYSLNNSNSFEEGLQKFVSFKNEVINNKVTAIKEDSEDLLAALKAGQTQESFGKLIDSQIKEIGNITTANKQARFETLYAPLENLPTDTSVASRSLIENSIKNKTDLFAELSTADRDLGRRLKAGVEQALYKELMEGDENLDKIIEAGGDVTTHLENQTKRLIDLFRGEVTEYFNSGAKNYNIIDTDVDARHVYIYLRETDVIDTDIDITSSDLFKVQERIRARAMDVSTSSEAGRQRRDAMVSTADKLFDSILSGVPEDFRIQFEGVEMAPRQYRDYVNTLYRLEVGERETKGSLFQKIDAADGEKYRRYFQGKVDVKPLEKDFVNMITKSGDEFIEASENFEKILRQSFGVPHIEGVPAREWLKTNDVNLYREELYKSMLSYEFRDMPVDSRNAVTQQMAAVARLLVGKTFLTESPEDFLTSQIVTAVKSPVKNESWMMKAAKEEGYLDKIKDTFTVNIDGEDVILFNPYDEFGGSVEKMVRNIDGVSVDRAKIDNMFSEIVTKAGTDQKQASKRYAEAMKIEMDIMETISSKPGSLFDTDNAMSLSSLQTFLYSYSKKGKIEEAKQALRNMLSDHLRDLARIETVPGEISERTGAMLKKINNPEKVVDWIDSYVGGEILDLLDVGDETFKTSLRQYMINEAVRIEDSGKGISVTGIPRAMSNQQQASKVNNVVKGLVPPSYFAFEMFQRYMDHRDHNILKFMLTDKEGGEILVKMLEDAGSVTDKQYNFLAERSMIYALHAGLISEQDIEADKEVVIEEVRSLIE